MSTFQTIQHKTDFVASKQSTYFRSKKIDLSKLDASENTMSLYTYPKEFLKLDLDKIREFIEILEEHYQKMAEQEKISQAKAAKQRLILLKNLEKEKMKKEAKIIYSNQRELIEDKMKEELDNYNESANKELESLSQVFESHEIELLKAQRQERNELIKNFDYIYESRRPKPSKEMLNLIRKKDYAVKQNKFDQAEIVEFDINELEKRENDKFEREKGNALKEDMKKLSKNHQLEKNALLKKKSHLINIFNQTRNKNIEQIKKKYEAKLKELKNYQAFEMASFDKITRGITKPSSRIQNIVNSTALVEGESEENGNDIKEKVKEKQDQKIIQNQEKKEENNINEENENEEIENKNDKEYNIDNNKNDNYEEKEYPIAQEERFDIYPELNGQQEINESENKIQNKD